MRWEYLLPGEFEDAVKKAKGVCVIPVGAMERHGTHLPLGCDALKGIAFTNAAADIAEVVSCPGAPYFGDMADYQDKGNICFPIPLIWNTVLAWNGEGTPGFMHYIAANGYVFSFFVGMIVYILLMKRKEGQFGYGFVSQAEYDAMTVE